MYHYSTTYTTDYNPLDLTNYEHWPDGAVYRTTLDRNGNAVCVEKRDYQFK